jgi:hypothetical protein
MRKLFAAAWVIGLTLVPASTQAGIITFNLSGTAGAGLLKGNENPAVVTGGSGGVVGAGITFNDVTDVLTINIAWGATNGFTNLTGNATASHIHGPTASGGTAAFTQNANVEIGLDTLAGFNNSASAGGFSGSVTFTAAQAADLLAGKNYINVHTAANSGGEIRGYLVAAPEPASLALFSVGVSALLMRTRRVATT